MTSSEGKTGLEAAQAARDAGLRYASDRRPGIRRSRVGEGFIYHDASGRELQDPETLVRVKKLAIPPAWSEVWICPVAEGHLQATGRDARGRKQYRYHAGWRAVRDQTKYNRMLAFGKALPKIRRRVRRDIRRAGLGRERVLAAVVRLLELSSVRVGNDEYAQQNRSYGLTTLQDRHARVKGNRIHLRFRGKSGKEHDLRIDHPVIAKVVKRCQDLPGQDLFQYVDDSGAVRDVTSGDVNDYLREITGEDFTAKDFRTWKGTVLAARELRGEPGSNQRQVKRKMVQAIARVAERLGNTPSVCKKCYIHPVILDSYLDGRLREVSQKAASGDLRPPAGEYRVEEFAVLEILEEGAGKEAAPLSAQLRESLARKRDKRRSHP